MGYFFSKSYLWVTRFRVRDQQGLVIYGPPRSTIMFPIKFSFLWTNSIKGSLYRYVALAFPGTTGLPASHVNGGRLIR